MGKTLIILPCSSKKKSGGVPKSTKITYFEDINHVPDLINARQVQTTKHSSTIYNPNLFLKAYARYEGVISRKLYEHKALVEKMIGEGRIDIVFISGLYGVINYDAEIPHYGYEISKEGGVRFWRDNNTICKSINNYLYETGVTSVHSFLTPKTYLIAVNGRDGIKGIENHWPAPGSIIGTRSILNQVANDLEELIIRLSKEKD